MSGNTLVVLVVSVAAIVAIAGLVIAISARARSGRIGTRDGIVRAGQVITEQEVLLSGRAASDSQPWDGKTRATETGSGAGIL